jgi:isoleucyl-tRNA synthetase
MRPGTALLGLPYKPLFSDLPGAGTPSAPLRVIPAAYVTATSGTGLVHTAPAHGAEDYAAFRALSLLSPAAPLICHVDDAGAFDAGVLEVVGAEGRGLVGQAVLGDGGRAMAALLKRVGVLVKAQRIKHRYPYDWKTKQPIIMRCVSPCAAVAGGVS